MAGAKQSGIGAEMGQERLEELTQAAIINMAKLTGLASPIIGEELRAVKKRVSHEAD